MSKVIESSMRRLLLCLPLLLAACAAGESQFTAFNKSGKDIQRLDVAVAGQRFIFSDFRKSSTFTQNYLPRHDGAFVVRATFESGKVVEGTAGYVTNGVEMKHEITVNGESITVRLISAN